MPNESFKPRDVDELLDYYLFRRLAAIVVRALAPTPITPNQVTVMAGAIGAMSGVAVVAAVEGPAWWLAVGALLLFTGMVLDCADGQLARIRGTSSMLGRGLDGMVDSIPTFSIFLGLALFTSRTFGLGTWGWLLAVGAGASTLWQTYIYDAAKNIYLSNTKPPDPAGSSGLVTIAAIEREMKVAREKHHWASWVVLWVFLKHASGQHKAYAKGQLPVDRAITSSPEEREIYRDLHLWPMRLWTWIGLATHLTLLGLGTIFAMADPKAPLWVWGIFLFPMNAMMLWLRITEAGRTNEALRRIAEVRAGAQQREQPPHHAAP
jgi:phosphatidylglycerophosphate synthase